MAVSSDAQVQQFFNERIRRRCEQIRSLYLACKDDQAVFGDIYENLTQPSPTFADTRLDVPVKANASKGLAWNTFVFHFIKFVEGTLTDQNKNEAGAQYAQVQSLCVRPVE